ncbi:uncharacterized protein [Atheta coriaria]|uniref:uncharacterized protein isoform X2 n=1 Tax=Dalotia coriaria TaxID=877792 RepID=UPI0031F43D78
MDKFQYNEQSHELFVKRETEYKPNPGGLGKYYDRLIQIATQDETIVAQIDAATGTTQTFKELLDASKKLAQYMRSVGIKPGDNIAMCSYNHINSEVVIVAALFVGAVMSSTDPMLSLEDSKHLLNMVKPKLLFVSDGSEELIEACVDAIELKAKIISVSLNSHNEYDTIEEILEKTTIEEDFEPFLVDDLNTVCSILFSSGTTGLPKGICLTHNYIFSSLSIYPTVILNWVILNYATFYWVSCVFNLQMSIQMGCARLLVRQFKKETHWSICSKYNVAYTFLSNTIFMEAAKYLPDLSELPSLKQVVVGGGLVPEKYLTTYYEKFPSIYVGYVYALTESGLVASYQAGDKFGSNGKPVPNNLTIKIVDPNTEENLPLTQTGEIRVKQAHQMAGYFKMDSKDAWDAQGFLKTGDLGYLDNDYNLFIVDRIKEMFKYRSWHIVPAKIENVLSSHPDVLYAIVIGKPTYNEDENHAMAIVCLHEKAHASAAELEAFVNQRMDNLNQIRAGVKIIDRHEIEFTPTGKINRRSLKSKFIS